MAQYYNYKNISFKNLNRISCPVCSNAQSYEIGKDNGYTICKCNDNKCRFIYVNPRPTKEQLNELYEKYYSDKAIIPKKWENEMAKINKECSKWLVQFSKRGWLLDIGCSFGHLLFLMEKKGWNTVGIEPSPIAADYAKRNICGEIIQANFENTDIKPESFDAIVSLYVLEHVNNPREFLDKIYNILRPGGMAIIRVPYPEKLIPILKFLNRPIFAAPMHLNGFSPLSMKRLARDIGFNKIIVNIGMPRKSSDLLEKIGASLLSSIGRMLEYLSNGNYIFPFSGSLSYRLFK